MVSSLSVCGIRSQLPVLFGVSSSPGHMKVHRKWLLSSKPQTHYPKIPKSYTLYMTVWLWAQKHVLKWHPGKMEPKTKTCATLALEFSATPIWLHIPFQTCDLGRVQMSGPFRCHSGKHGLGDGRDGRDGRASRRIIGFEALPAFRGPHTTCVPDAHSAPIESGAEKKHGICVVPEACNKNHKGLADSEENIGKRSPARNFQMKPHGGQSPCGMTACPAQCQHLSRAAAVRLLHAPPISLSLSLSLSLCGVCVYGKVTPEKGFHPKCVY